MTEEGGDSSSYDSSDPEMYAALVIASDDDDDDEENGIGQHFVYAVAVKIALSRACDNALIINMSYAITESKRLEEIFLLPDSL